MMAWDTLAVLMAGYESSEQGAGFVDLRPYINARVFRANEMPDPRRLGAVFQRR